MDEIDRWMDEIDHPERKVTPAWAEKNPLVPTEEEDTKAPQDKEQKKGSARAKSWPEINPLVPDEEE